MAASTPTDQRDLLIGPILPALEFGTASSLLGVCIGGGVGILRSAHPGIAAVYTGAQFFVLGSTASYTRDAILIAKKDSATRPNELVASTVAGAVSGAAAGRFWGRVSSLSGCVAFGLIGYLSQRSMHKSRDAEPVDRDRRSMMQKFADLKWSPMKSLSNDEYENMLTERLIRIETEIALLDEKLQTLQRASTAAVTAATANDHV